MARVFWTQQSAHGPSPRTMHAMAYDPVRKIIVLFGGRSPDTDFGDTWGWDGSLWTQLSDVGASARNSHAVAFDTLRGQVLLFGGASGSFIGGDTWIWDGTSWTQVADVGPSPRWGHAMAYDATRQRIVVFGGLSRDGTALGDTWEWDGSAWTQREDTGPGPRSGHCLTHDRTRDAVVLFGGARDPDGLGDTWEWDGNAWSEVAHFGPSARSGATLVTTGGAVTLFGGARIGGSPESSSVFGDTWEWNGQRWTEQQHFGPSPRTGHAMAYDDDRRQVVLFGGTSRFPATDPSAMIGDTWQHAPAASAGPSTPSSSQLRSMDIEPAQVAEGGTFTVNVALAAAASVQAAITLSSEPEIPGLPPQLVVQAGQTAVTSEPIPSPLSGVYKLTASLGSVTRSVSFTVEPAAPAGGLLAAFALFPNVRDVDESLTALVSLEQPVETETSVALSSVPPIPGLPDTIRIQPGSNQGQVSFSSVAPGSFALVASSGTQSLPGTLTITPAGGGTELASLQIFPESTQPGRQFTVVVSIRNIDVVESLVLLQATPSIPTLPTQLLVPAQQDIAISSLVEAPPPGSYTITATAGGVSMDATLSVE